MAEAGGYVSLVSTVNAPPSVVAQTVSMALPSGGNYFDGTVVVPAGPTMFRVTRRYLPQWAVISGIIGLFCFFVGIFAVFFRDTEELIVDIQPDGQGSRVTVAGTGKPEVVAMIQSTLARFPGFSSYASAFAAPQSPGVAATPPVPSPASTLQMSPDRQYWWDGAAWQSAATSVPPGAQISPDGSSWWDGQEWRRITRERPRLSSNPNPNTAP